MTQAEISELITVLRKLCDMAPADSEADREAWLRALRATVWPRVVSKCWACEQVAAWAESSGCSTESGRGSAVAFMTSGRAEIDHYGIVPVVASLCDEHRGLFQTSLALLPVGAAMYAAAFAERDE